MRPVVTLEYAADFPAALGLPAGSHRGPLWAKKLGSGILALLAAVVVGPQIALAVEALSNPEMRAIIADRPLIAIELGFALFFWIGLFAWPLMRLRKTLKEPVKVVISGPLVTVERRRGRSTESLTLPVAAYLGLSRYTRSSLSGIEQVLVLEHPNPAQSLTLLVDEHIPDRMVVRLAEILDVPQIEARRARRSLPVRAEIPSGSGALALAGACRTASF